MDTRIIKSSTFRLALIYMSFFICSVLIILVLIYWSTVRYLTSQTDIVINNEINNFISRYNNEGLTGLSLLLEEYSSHRLTGSSIYLLADSRLNPIQGNLSHWPLDMRIETGWLNFELNIEEKEFHIIHPARAKIFRLKNGLLLLVGRDLHELETTKRVIMESLLTSFFVMLLLAVIGSTLLSRYTLHRIEIINKASNKIISGDLSNRIPNHGSGDEFDTLANNLNTMLDKIELLMESVKRVSDNIAHDLRTPLSRLRNHLEEIYLDFDRSEHASEKVRKAVDEADGLLRSFNALLRIVRVESEESVVRFQPVNMEILTRDVVELYEPLVEQKGQRLEIDLAQVKPVNGDRDILFQAIANLLDNAIKYSPKNGLIQIILEKVGEDEKLIIADSGSGIPSQDHEKVFQRFFRMDKSRSTPGDGLGLSLVSAVMKLHKMNLSFEDNLPGLKVIIEFP